MFIWIESVPWVFVAVFWLSKFCGPGSQFLSCGDSGRLIDGMGLFTFSLLIVRSSANATGCASSLGGRSRIVDAPSGLLSFR